MRHEDRIRLVHMREAALLVQRFVEGRERSDVDSDIQLQFALVRAFEIIGEAASRVSGETRSTLPHIPWTRIIGIRNRLIHAYFTVDQDILWNTATTSIPELLTQLEEAFPD